MNFFKGEKASAKVCFPFWHLRFWGRVSFPSLTATGDTGGFRVCLARCRVGLVSFVLRCRESCELCWAPSGGGLLCLSSGAGQTTAFKTVFELQQHLNVVRNIGVRIVVYIQILCCFFLN